MHRVLAATFALVLAAHEGMWPQIAGSQRQEQVPQAELSPSASRLAQDPGIDHGPSSVFALEPEFSLPIQPLFESKDSNTKFRLGGLMSVLRDSRHESWVLVAYPDPKTGRPLIGAGFSLDVRSTQHIQSDPLNSHEFVEPSTAQLWQAAGLDLARLQEILDQFERDKERWTDKQFRKKIRAHELPPQITEEEGTKLLRISALQAVHNARAYCNCFDGLTASQQMALSQLVYQMGANLEGFTQFLNIINDGHNYFGPTDDRKQTEYWKMVQRTLILSDWARRYAARAIAVIAMFDPNYDQDPKDAERAVGLQLGPYLHRDLRASRRKRAAHAVAGDSRRKTPSSSTGT